MLYSTIDVRTRVAQFDALQANAAEALRQGVYDGLPYDIDSLIEGMRPVGLDMRRRIVHPRDYEPEAGPPILMFRPGDLGKIIRYSEFKGKEVDLAWRIATQANSTTATLAVDKDPVTDTSDFAGFIYSNPIWLPREIGVAPKRPILVPRNINIGPNVLSHVLGFDLTADVIGHEFDHWDYYINHQGALQGNMQSITTLGRLVAIGEKRGYETSRQIYKNLGYKAIAPTIEEIAEPYVGISQHQLIAMGKDMSKRQVAANPGRPNGQHISALIMQVITHLYGRPDEAITHSEYLAMHRLGLVNA